MWPFFGSVGNFDWVQTVGSTIRRLRKERKLTLDQLCRRLANCGLELSTSGLSKRERDDTFVGRDEWPAFAAALEVPYLELVREIEPLWLRWNTGQAAPAPPRRIVRDDDQPVIREPDDPTSRPPRGIPLINAVSAGGGGDYYEWGEVSADAPEYVDATGYRDIRNLFALRVHGRSMEPTLTDGDIVICQWLDQHADDGHEPILDGQVVMVRIRTEDGGYARIARWNTLPNGTIRLSKDNAVFASTEWPRAAFEQVAKVVERRTTCL